MNNYYSPYKICHHTEKIKQLKKNPQYVVPAQVMLALTSHCNFKCKYCFNKDFVAKSEKEFLCLDDIKLMMYDCARMKVKAIHITGAGEPTIHPHFLDVVNYIGMLKMKIGLVTNGTACNLLQEEYKYFDWIRVSIDAHDKKSFNYFHGLMDDSNRFNRLMELPRWIKQYNKNTIVGFSYIVTKNNYQHVGDAMQKAKENKFDNFRITPVHVTNYEEDHFVNDSLRNEIIKDINYQIGLFQDDKFKVFFQGDRFGLLQDKNKNFKECYYQDMVVFIGADGVLNPCCEMQKKYETNSNCVSFKKAWESRKRIKVSECDRVCFYSKQNELMNYLVEDDPAHVNYV